jgi:nucleotide-binding universal stress UspA family protein
VFTTIAWATDNSPSALNALPTAKKLARRFGAQMAIIHVQEVIASRAGVFVDSDDGTVDALHETDRKLREEGIDTEVLVSRAPAGSTARTIVDLATKAEADLIVVGNRGHGPLAGIVLGSVALRLLQSAPYPVLTVPSGYTAQTPAPVADLTTSSSPVR